MINKLPLQMILKLNLVFGCALAVEMVLMSVRQQNHMNLATCIVTANMHSQ